MTKSKQPRDDLEPDLPAETETEYEPPKEGEAVPVGEMRPGWRTPLDNPAHPLHHLRDA
jgi:hypothetical protein